MTNSKTFSLLLSKVVGYFNTVTGCALVLFIASSCKDSKNSTYIIYKVEPQTVFAIKEKHQRNKELEDALVNRYTGKRIELTFEDKFASGQFVDSDEEIVLATEHKMDGTHYYIGNNARGTAKLYYNLSLDNMKLEITGEVENDKPIVIPVQMGKVLQEGWKIEPNKAKILCYLEKID